MGIDWYRVRPKDFADPDELRVLIERQATAFQAITKFWMATPIDLPDDSFDQEEKEWMDEYKQSSDYLYDLLECSPYDEDLFQCTDIPDLDAGIPIFTVIGNPIFPPQWRKNGCRSILAEDLPDWIKLWRNWIRDVSLGKYRGYLLELWAYKQSMMLFHHWDMLQGCAEATIGRTNNWVKKPKFLEAREKVFNLKAPSIHPAPAFFDQKYPWSERLRSEMEQACADLVSVTRQWDSCVKESFKLRYYRRHYYSFDEFIENGISDSFTEGLDWLDRCCSLGFGMYLDY